MKKINANILAHLGSSVTSIATCWYIKLQNGKIFGFTDHDQDITVNDNTYFASAGFSCSSIESKNTLAVDNLEIRAILNEKIIKKQDLLDGVFDMAEILVFKVNYLEPDQGNIILHRGWIGEITIKDNKFFAEVRGVAQKTATNISEVYSETCRAQFGDSRCKVNLNELTYEAEVTQAKDSTSFYSAKLIEHGKNFSHGKGRFLTGENQELQFQVKESSNGSIRLLMALPHNIKENDRFQITYGCDKRFSTCSKKYNNFLNFRAEPHIPEL